MSEPGEIYVRNGKKPTASAFAHDMASRLVGVSYDNTQRTVSISFCNRRGKTAFAVDVAKYLVLAVNSDKQAARFAESLRIGLAVAIDRALSEYHYRQQHENDHYEDDSE